MKLADGMTKVSHGFTCSIQPKTVTKKLIRNIIKFNRIRRSNVCNEMQKIPAKQQHDPFGEVQIPAIEQNGSATTKHHRVESFSADYKDNYNKIMSF